MIASPINTHQFEILFKCFCRIDQYLLPKFPWMAVRHCRLATALMEMGEIESALGAVKTGLNKDSSELVGFTFQIAFLTQAVLPYSP